MNQGKVMMSRQEIEHAMCRAYLGKVITYTDIRNNDITGKVHRLAVESATGELMVIFNLNHTRYECDLNYFFSNVTRNGNTHGRDTGNTGLQEGD